MSDQYITYVACGNYQEFKDFARNNPDRLCEMLIDGNTLRGRGPGLVEECGSFKDRWDYLDILESIERQKTIWKNENNFDQTHDLEIDNTEDDIYGGFK